MADETIEAKTAQVPPVPRFMGQYLARPLPRISLRQTFAALKYRNYRLWFAGQLVSLVGTWMQSTAQGFLIFDLARRITGDPRMADAYLGYVTLASGIPPLLFMLYGGVVADRMPRRTLLILTQTTMMVLAFILAGLTFLNLVQPIHIIVLAFFLGVANAFDAPARQAFVLEMVEREDLTNAIALNSTMFNLATVVGPAIGGLTYAAVGPGWCFTINGLTFIAVIIALLLMRLKPFVAEVRQASAMEDLKKGLRYVASHRVIQAVLGVVTLTSLFGMAYVALIPAWAVNVLGGNATTNGYLQSARGLGALLGALMIASLGRIRFKGKLLTLGTFAFPILLIVFALMRWLPLSLLALVGVGWSFMILFNTANALVQTLVADELRGRVMAIYSLTFFGTMPIGGLLAGVVASKIGEPETVILGALISLVFAGLIWWRVPRLRALE